MIYLSELLKRLDIGIEERVLQTKARFLVKLQNALRVECRLTINSKVNLELTFPAARVPIKVSPGLPECLEDFSFSDEIKDILFITDYKSHLEKIVNSSDDLIKLRQQLEFSQCEQDVTENEIESVRIWARKLLGLIDESHPIKKILSFNEDILGVYKYGLSNNMHDHQIPNKAEIEIYWGVIGLVSKWLGPTVEDMTCVVLAHELAHAYTQLGADIDGRRWNSSDFSETEPALQEGLAQYYTERVLKRLKTDMPGAYDAYTELLEHQPKNYHTHVSWVINFSPETVRRAMIETRRKREKTVEQFELRLKKAERGLRPPTIRQNEF